jgi:hypothetical protein
MSRGQTYRSFAQDCERFADEIPEHRSRLLDMAHAWHLLAEEHDYELGTAETGRSEEPRD